MGGLARSPARWRACRDPSSASLTVCEDTHHALGIHRMDPSQVRVLVDGVATPFRETQDFDIAHLRHCIGTSDRQDPAAPSRNPVVLMETQR